MIKLVDFQTFAPDDLDKNEIKEKTIKYTEKIANLQYSLFGEGKHSLLVIIHGMDASGKDGVTAALFGGCRPGGVAVHSFKKPTEIEMAHDFLWRVHQVVPPKGMVHVFNRSHYEDVLIQRVHGWIDEARVAQRIAAINAFETLLAADNQTTVVKIFLNISKEKQKEKLQERIDDPTKNWKHKDGDWTEREHWDDYMRCYEDVFNRCKVTPWHIVPADERWYRDYTATKIIIEALEKMNCQLPLLAQIPK